MKTQKVPSREGFFEEIRQFATPPMVASIAIVPSFRDMAAKSEQQRGLAVSCMTGFQAIKGGVHLAPTVGVLVGTQMIVQDRIEQALKEKVHASELSMKFMSSAVTGVSLSPIVAVFNGKTMGWEVRKSLQKFSLKQAGVISAQETAFVAGISVADPLAVHMKERLGDNKVVDCAAAFISGAAGSLAGHPANTALTRWQNDLTVDSLRQLSWGSLRKARAVGVFSVVYKLGKDTLNPKAS